MKTHKDIIKEKEKEMLPYGTTYAKVYARAFVESIETVDAELSWEGYTDGYAVVIMHGHLKMMFQLLASESFRSNLESYFNKHPSWLYEPSDFLAWSKFPKLFKIIMDPKRNMREIPLPGGGPESRYDKEQRLRIFFAAMDDKNYREWLYQKFKKILEDEILTSKVEISTLKQSKNETEKVQSAT